MATIKSDQMELACVPAIGHNNIAAAYEKLIRWAAPLGLLIDSIN